MIFNNFRKKKRPKNALLHIEMNETHSDTMVKMDFYDLKFKTIFLCYRCCFARSQRVHRLLEVVIIYASVSDT